MAKYPVKMLKDEQNQPFVPLVSAESIYTNDDLSFEEKFATKLEADNLKEGNGIILEQNGNDTTISVDFGATDNIIDNLNTTIAGQGPLDARQGNILKNMIPTIVDNLDSTDATKVLSANQGHELREMSVPTGGATGQVLKKASDNDHELEWGDAADPNAIVGNGSIMKIVELTYAEYKTLESNGELKEDTEYHITDVENGTAAYITADQIQLKIEANVVDKLNSTETTKSLSAAQGKNLNDRISGLETHVGSYTPCRIVGAPAQTSMGAVMTYLAQSCGDSGIDSTYCPIAAQWIDDNIATCINKNVNISSGGPNYQACVMGINNLYTAIFTNYTATYIVLLRRVYDNYYGTYIGQ